MNTIWTRIALARNTFINKTVNGRKYTSKVLLSGHLKKVSLAHTESTQIERPSIYLLFCDHTFWNAIQTQFSRCEYVTCIVAGLRFTLVAVCQAHWRYNMYVL